jgi:hypothetical protein
MKLSANTVAFISCRNRLTTRGEREVASPANTLVSLLLQLMLAIVLAVRFFNFSPNSLATLMSTDVSQVGTLILCVFLYYYLNFYNFELYFRMVFLTFSVQTFFPPIIWNCNDVIICIFQFDAAQMSW